MSTLNRYAEKPIFQSYSRQKSWFFCLQVKAKLNAFLQGDKADDGKTGVVNVVLIVILTAVIVLMFFTGVYLYYMRGGKQYAKEFKDR